MNVCLALLHWLRIISAGTWYFESANIYEALGDEARLCMLFNNLGWLCLTRGQSGCWEIAACQTLESREVWVPVCDASRALPHRVQLSLELGGPGESGDGVCAGPTGINRGARYQHSIIPHTTSSAWLMRRYPNTWILYEACPGAFRQPSICAKRIASPFSPALKAPQAG